MYVPPVIMRLDQWLWAVRIFKTRSLAATAVRGGRVKVNGAATKPAHEARPGAVIAVRVDIMTRTLRVIDAPPSRVGAKLAPLYVEDLTPPEEYEKQRAFAAFPQFGQRPRGAGRPTKKERRVIEDLTATVAEGEPEKSPA